MFGAIWLVCVPTSAGQFPVIATYGTVQLAQAAAQPYIAQGYDAWTFDTNNPTSGWQKVPSWLGGIKIPGLGTLPGFPGSS